MTLLLPACSQVLLSIHDGMQCHACRRLNNVAAVSRSILITIHWWLTGTSSLPTS